MLEIRQKTRTMDALKVVDSLPPEGGWLELTAPTDQEIERAVKLLGVPDDVVRAALDDEEQPRIELTKEYTLLILDVPHLEEDVEKTLVYQTYPIGIIATPNAIATVSLYETGVLRVFRSGAIPNYSGQQEDFSAAKHSRFTLQLVREVAAAFVTSLRRIDDMSTALETRLHKSMKNEALIQMLSLGKSLVYFSTSLKSNQTVLRRMMRIPLYTEHADDSELLEDVLIETEQAIEMADIYMNILNSTMDTFASIISNNLNIVMKILASATIIITIPTLFAGFWGMNVPVPFESHPYGFFIVIGVSLLVSVAVTLGLWKRNYL